MASAFLPSLSLLRSMNHVKLLSFFLQVGIESTNSYLRLPLKTENSFQVNACKVRFSMLHPFQCVLACFCPTKLVKDVIIAASGSSICSFDTFNGSLLSVWSSEGESSNKSQIDAGTSPPERGLQRPEKRRKLSSSGNASDSSSAEIVVENGRNKRRRPRRQDLISPSIIKLVCTSNCEFIIAVTGEDKCIRVFSLLESGILEQLSER